MLVAGISNVVLVSASDDASQINKHSLAMTVDGGTNHYWAWGGNYFGQIGNATNWGNSASYNQYSPVQPQFCTRCQRCAQLGTSGILTAQCSGPLYLYFNGEIGKFGDYSGSYTVTVNNVSNTVSAYDGGNWGVGTNPYGPGAAGVSFGTVTAGGTYNFSATGYCFHDPLLPPTDANGNPTNGTANCSSINIINAVCPARQCFSLVGRIQ
jgi:hypothetical protein